SAALLQQFREIGRLPPSWGKVRKRSTRWLYFAEKGNYIMRKLVIGMAMASTALASPALARDGQWYIEGQGGPMIVEDLDFDILDADGEVVETAGADTDKGYDFGGVVGYDFGGFRLEADVGYRSAPIDTVT